MCIRDSSTTIGQQLFTDLRSYIDDRYEDVYATSYAEHTRHLQALLEDMAQAAPSIDCLLYTSRCV